MLKWIAIGSGIAGLALLVIYLVFGKPITVDIAESRVQSEVAQRLPMTIEKSGITTQITDLEVDFLDSDKVHVDIEMDLSGFGAGAHASGAATSGLRYSDGDFFLEDIDLSDFDVTPTKSTVGFLADASATANSLWSKFKKDKLEDDPEDAQAAERLKDRALSKLKPAALTMANSALENIPVYTLKGKNLKMDLAALALVDVHFRDQSVQAELSPLRPLVWLASIGAMIAISFVIALGTMTGVLRGGFF